MVKIASGFPGNGKLGLSNSQGAMVCPTRPSRAQLPPIRRPLQVVFSLRTGQLQGVLMDDGHRADLRAAAGCAVMSRCLVPKTVEAIGIVGTGVQARMQLEWLKWVTNCRKVALSMGPLHQQVAALRCTDGRAWV